MKQCPNCKTKYNNSDDFFCTQCNFWLSDIPDDSVPLYKVIATYSETKRKRTITLPAQSIAELKEILLDSGFVEPFEIENAPPKPIYEKTYTDDEPTEKQLAYANDLGITFPNDITRRELSELISIEEDDDNQANPELVEFAEGRNFKCGKYIGKNYLYNTIWNNFTGIHRIAFFIFCVYRFCSDDRRGNLDIHPFKEKFYSIANELSSNEAFIRSMNKYYGNQLKFFGNFTVNRGNGETFTTTGGSTSTIAYKTVCDCLKRNLGVEKRTSKTMSDKSNHKSDKSFLDNIDTSKWGCFGYLAAFAIAILLFSISWIPSIIFIPIMWFFFKWDKSKKIKITIWCSIIFVISLSLFIYLICQYKTTY